MKALRWILVALSVLAPGLAWHLGPSLVWPVTAALYLVAAGLAGWMLHDDGVLRAVVVPRAGDVASGVAVATGLYLVAWLVLVKWAAPEPALRLCTLEGARVPRPGAHGLMAVGEWLRHSACAAFARSSELRGTLRGVAVVLIALAEEVAWRGGVQGVLSEKLGSTRGWLAAGVLYALASAVTGNGVVVALALPAGLAWGALYLYRGRLAPAIVSHCVFSWFFFHNLPLLGLAR